MVPVQDSTELDRSFYYRTSWLAYSKMIWGRGVGVGVFGRKMVEGGGGKGSPLTAC